MTADAITPGSAAGFHDLTIERLGAKGDGVAKAAHGDVYVPFALPEETWRMFSNGASPERRSVSPNRVPALCRHFEACGGCVAQHIAPGLYAAWKREAIVAAFAHRGIEATVADLVTVKPHSRRRAFFGIETSATGTLIGFREDGSHTLVPLSECPVLDPMIVAAFPVLKQMAAVAMPQRISGRLIVTRLDTGLDVSFDNGHKTLNAAARQTLANLSRSAHICRLIVAGDLIVMPQPPVLTFDGVAVSPPSGIFLQAVPEAERVLIELLLEALPPKAKRVADLFCGIGTFTIPLAKRVQVMAADSEARALDALKAGLAHAQGLKPVEVLKRDLFREPLSPRELDGFDCVVFDPPRAGASEQTERIARSKVRRVVAVSCAPATLARDARTLIDAGFTMGTVTPIDQFLYTPHTEAIAVFSR